MKVNLYPIRSSLQHSDLDSTTKEFLQRLESKGNITFNLVDLDSLYNDCDCSMLLVQSGGSEGLFLEIFSKLKSPIYLLTYGSNNSLAASIEILSFLKKNNIQGEIIHGSDSYVEHRITELAVHRTFGVIGKPSDWLIASLVNVNDIKKHFNADIVLIETNELMDEYNKLSDVAYDDSHSFDDEEKQKAYKVYFALKNIVTKYKLSGLTIRCFDLLSTLNTTSCLALAKLNDEGIISSCEGDVPALITMQVVKEVTGLASFQANPSSIDIESNTMVLAHCTIPLSMCETYEYDTHFESGIGLGIKGKLELGKITVLKISSDMEHYFISSGKIIETGNSRSLCRTQVKIKLDESVSYFLSRPLGNHHIIVLGDHVKEIENYLLNHGLERVK